VLQTIFGLKLIGQVLAKIGEKNLGHHIAENKLNYRKFTHFSIGIFS